MLIIGVPVAIVGLAILIVVIVAIVKRRQNFSKRGQGKNFKGQSKDNNNKKNNKKKQRFTKDDIQRNDAVNSPLYSDVSLFIFYFFRGLLFHSLVNP